MQRCNDRWNVWMHSCRHARDNAKRPTASTAKGPEEILVVEIVGNDNITLLL